MNELLSFEAHKLNLMAPDTIVQLSSSFYDEMEIDSAKALLYDLCADRDDRQDRMIKRSSGPRKKSEISPDPDTPTLAVTLTESTAVFTPDVAIDNYACYQLYL